MRFCTTHRACETARSLDGLADPYCEVGLHLVMGHDFDSYCTLVDALIVTKEDGEWPEWAAKAVSSFLEVDEDGAPQGRKPNPKKLDELLQAQYEAAKETP